VNEIDASLAAGLARRFRIVRRLGAGGMGTVFLAEQIAVGNRPVALKVLNRKLLDDPEFLLRFQNEAASTGRICHPNVVTIYESGQGDDGTPYIAMEYLEGETLRTVLKMRGALPVAECAEILQQAARGLNAAHKLGIIHRDLKPDNIFLTYSEEESVAPASSPANVEEAVAPVSPPANVLVKLVDFGIAKLRESATHTLTGTVLGTPAYMSYEQASGMKSDELDARSDIYSLGVVAYEMLTGRTPFYSDTPLGYVRKHTLEEPPPFRVAKPELPALPQVEGVVMKALTKDRDQRYPSVLDFAREFAPAAATDCRAAARFQPQVTPVLVPERPHLSRRRRFVVAGCFAFLLVAAAAGFWYWAIPGLRPERRQPVSPPDINLGPFVLKGTLNGNILVETVTFSPDGKLLAYGGVNSAIKLWDVTSKTLRQTLRGNCIWVMSVAFSPDGRSVASDCDRVSGSPKTASEGVVELWDVASGTLRQTLTASGWDAVRSVAFSLGGKLIASGSARVTTTRRSAQEGGIQLWDAASGEHLQTLSGHSDVVTSVAFSADGRLLASGSADKTIKLWDLASGTLRQMLTGDNDYVESVAFSPDTKLLASGGGDKTIKLWDVASGTLKQTLTGHRDSVNSVAFSPDGKLLASGSADTTIKLWAVAAGTLRQTLTGHTGVVSAVAFSPDGKLLASGSSDKSIRLWQRGSAH
jgi:hypothetical protein